jgi:hypothetical protein
MPFECRLLLPGYRDGTQIELTIGISLKTQELYSIVFIARYLDLFTNFVSLYNTFMKIFFIAATLGTVYLIRVTYRKTYTDNFDTFRTIFVIAPAFLLALIINEEFSAMEVCPRPLPILGRTEPWQRSTVALRRRCFGLSRSISRQWPSSRSFSFSSERARRITFQRRSWHALVPIARSTC